MTFQRILQTGSGTLSVRIVIEGLEVEFVSDPAMEKTTDDGRRRVCCLPPMAAGFKIEDKVNIPEAVLEAMGTGLRVLENQAEDLSRVFHHAPDVEIPIEVTIEVEDTTVFLLNTAGLSEGDVVHVGTEAMLINSIDGTALSVTRGYWDTIPQKHWSNEPSLSITYRTLYNRPLSVRGRRLYVHLYGDGDDLQGDGTQVWIGHVKSDPACIPDTGVWWRLSVGSIADRLKSKLGGGLEVPATPRGIYYSWEACLSVFINEDGVGNVQTALSGHFETQRAFVDALSSLLESSANDASLTHHYEAIEEPGGRWTVRIRLGATVNVSTIQINIASEQDGTCAGGGTFGGFEDDDGNLVTGTATIGTNLRPFWTSGASDARRLVPRGFFGHTDFADRTYRARRNPSAATTAPLLRIYLDRPFPTDADVALISWPDGLSGEYDIEDRDATANWILVSNRVITAPPSTFHATFYGRHAPPTIEPFRSLGSGDVSALRDALVAEGPEYANRGTAPFLTTSDLADWSGVAAELAHGTPLRQRVWTLATTVEVDEVLSHELRLLGAFPIIDADGKIAIARLDTPNPSSVDATTIDDEIVSVGWSTMERGGQTINRVELHLGYNPREDEWTRVVDTFDEESYAQDHQDRLLEIKPRSRALIGDENISPLETVAIAGPIFGLFGYPHDYVTVNVSWKLFGLLLGSFVAFSADHLPDYLTGRRPIAEALGIVVGRKWELGKAYGTLTLLMPRLRIGGYAPTARVLSASGGEDNKWTLTVDHELYAPRDEATGAIRRNTDAFFETFDRVVIREWDSESPTTQTGFVTSVDVVNHNILVQFDGSWTPGSSIWELSYQNHASVQESQKRFAFIAGADALDADGRPARRFAP